MSLWDGFLSLGAKDNKVETEKTESTTNLVPELSLEMSDDELIRLKDNWLKAWEEGKKALEAKQTKNEEYWLGQQFGSKEGAVDNLIFESLETALPIMTRAKPEPLVELGNEEGNEEIKAQADSVRKMLIYQADIQSLNLTLKQVARFWSLYFLGVAKVGWSDKEGDITTYALRPQKLVLDPNATIENGWYNGDYIGEEKSDTASNLITKFGEDDEEGEDGTKNVGEIKKYLTEQVKDKLGSKLTYHEWWHDDYVFWTHNKQVLGKAKNPHWNEDQESQEPAIDPMTGQPVLDEMGQPVMNPVTIPGRNHFKTPSKPYVFLSVFSLGKHPYDDTNLIEQNLGLQDLVNKRLKQIDKNADGMNGGLKASGDYFTKEQANEAGEALRKGKTIWVPTGDVNAAISRDSVPALPTTVYESLLDYRNELRNVFGTRGSTPQGTINEKTATGKLTIKGQDSDRIGGGISVYLEQFADNLFNWWVQLMYVYYDETHTGSILGKERAMEYISIKNSDLPDKLVVSVKEGSMIPKDPLTKRNEASDLWASKAIDPITLFERLDFPNPREAAKQLYLWQADPIQLFPELAQQQQEQMMAEQEAQQVALQQQKGEEFGLEQVRRAEDQENKLAQIETNNLTKI